MRAKEEERGHPALTLLSLSLLQVDALAERLQQRLARVETDYGLAQASAEIEELHAAIKRRDEDIARLSRSAGMQLDSHDNLLEIARRLAER